MDYVFNIVNYFSSLRLARGDDPLTAEWKAKQLRAWTSLLFLVLGFGLSALLANALDTLESATLLQGLAEQLRPSAAYIVGGGLSILLLFAAYSWWSVLRVAQKHGVE